MMRGLGTKSDGDRTKNKNMLVGSGSGGKKKNLSLRFEGGIDMIWNGHKRPFGDSFLVQVDKKYLYFGDKGNWTIRLQELNVLPLEQVLEKDDDDDSYDNDNSILLSDMKGSKQFICHYELPSRDSNRRGSRRSRKGDKKSKSTEGIREAVKRFLETVLQRSHQRGTPAKTTRVSPKESTTSATKSRYRKSYGKRNIARMLETDFYTSDRDAVEVPPSSPLSSSSKENNNKRLKKESSSSEEDDKKLFPVAATPFQILTSECSIPVTDEEDQHNTSESPTVAAPSNSITSFFTAAIGVHKSTSSSPALNQTKSDSKSEEKSTEAPETKSKNLVLPVSPKSNNTNAPNTSLPNITIPNKRCTTPDKKSTTLAKPTFFQKLTSNIQTSPLVKSSPSSKSSTSKSSQSVKSKPNSDKRGLQDFFSKNRANQEVEKGKIDSVIKNPPLGFRNLGNTCYLNSSLQILFSTKGFMDDLHRLYTQTWNLSDSHPMLPITSALLTIAKDAGVLYCTKTSTTSVDPTQLKQAMDQATDKFQGYEQRDAHEFISDLIDILHEELVEYNKSKHTNTNAEEKKETDHTSLPTDKYFYLNIKVCLTCDSCSYTRCKQEMYRHLSIDVGDKPDEKWTAEKGLKQFFQPEKLDIRCEKCKDGVSATQTLEMTSCPNALLLHLKRFIFSDSTFRKNKKRVVLPPKLQVGSFCPTSENEAIFKLGGVVHHIGSSSSSGHYTTDAERSDKWVSFDDHTTKFTSLSHVLSSEQKQHNSYLILYQKQ